MASKLQVVSEVEVPEPAPAVAPAPKVTEQPSKSSSPPSPQFLLILAEIRKVLSVRMGALIAMSGAFLLTAAAMYLGTYMALAMSLGFDALVFLPVALIAYLGRSS